MTLAKSTISDCCCHEREVSPVNLNALSQRISQLFFFFFSFFFTKGTQDSLYIQEVVHGVCV